MKCTWKDCQSNANHSQVDKDDQEWANLCDEHDAELTSAINSLNAKTLVRAWARAGHGHPKREQMSQRLAKGVGQLASKLKSKIEKLKGSDND